MAAGCKPSHARARGERGGFSRLHGAVLLGVGFAAAAGLNFAPAALAGLPPAPNIFNTPLHLPGAAGASDPSIAFDGAGNAYVAASDGSGLGCVLDSYSHDGGTGKYLGRPEGGTGCAIETGPSQQGAPMSLAYLADGPGELIFSRSTDAGKHFSSQEIAGMTSVGPGSMAVDPQLGLSGQATVFALVNDAASNVPVLATSIDGGLSYVVGASPLNPADLAPGTLQGAKPIAGNLVTRRDDTGLRLYTALATADGAADAANLDCIYLAVGTVTPSLSANVPPTVTWSDTLVHESPAIQLNRPLPEAAVDSAGHLYVAYSDGTHVYVVANVLGTPTSTAQPAAAAATLAPTPSPSALPSLGANVPSIPATPTASPSPAPHAAAPQAVSPPAPIAVDAKSGIPGGLSSSVFPSLAAGGNGLVDLVWYGATSGASTADAHNQWSVYMAQTADMGATWTAYAVTSQIIHQGALCVAGDAACAGAQQSLPDPSVVPGLQLALDQVSGAALVVFDNDVASPGLPTLDATRQCGGLSAVSGHPLNATCAAPNQPAVAPAVSTCPGPQITDTPGDAIDDTAQGSGANVLNLDITQEVLNQTPSGDLQAAIAVQYLDTQPGVADITAETWALYWTYKNVNYFAESTITTGSQPTFRVGTLNADGTPAPGHVVTGTLVPGGGGNIVIDIPAGDAGSPPVGASLDREYAISYATFAVGAPTGGLIPVDRAPDAGFGAPAEITLCPPAADIPEVPLAAMLPISAAVGGAILLGLRRKGSRRSVKESDEGGIQRGSGIPVNSENS